MTEESATTSGTPHLNKALAAFQAEMPVIAKGETATIPGSNGKQGYKYSYADLAAISAVASPLLGKHGLAFTAKPTLLDGQFVLMYSLRHESGEHDDGVMPLPASGRPQDLGSLLTYYRRYAKCAVCDIALGGEDDDASLVNNEQRFDTRSAGAAFDNATPAEPRGRQPGQPDGHAVRPERQDRAPVSATELDPDAQQYADEACEARTLPALHEIHVRARKAHKLAALITNPATGGTGGLGQYLNWRKAALEKADKAYAALQAAAEAAAMTPSDLEDFAKAQGTSIEAATAEQMAAMAALITEAAAAPEAVPA